MYERPKKEFDFVSISKRRLALTLILAIVAAATVTPEAAAFYPLGFFNNTGQLIFPKWDFDYMDTNGDGDISGPSEGVLFHFEGGELGWTDQEKVKLIAGFETWENIPSCYIAFQYGQDIADPVELSASLTEIDFLNVVAIQLPDDDVQVTFDVYVFNLNTYVTETTTIDVGGTQVYVAGGQILDYDLVYAGERTRALETAEGSGIQGLTAFAVGSVVGLEYSPWDNLDAEASQAAGRNVEKRVVWMRDATGTLIEMGVTPTLTNLFVYYDEGNGIYEDSLEDLAPDDIAGATFLYPRANEDRFFTIAQQARTTTRQGFPSAQIAGGHIMAWCDADNNPASGRVPFLDCLTGLYEQDTNFRGNFRLINLFNQLEDANGVTFPANYTVTCSVFEPNNFEQADYDSTHGGDGFGFDALFPSQVFREDGNLFGLNNLDQGTPLEFDLTRRQVVSVNSGKTLSVMLAGGRPMFGDQNAVCPLNVIVAGMKTNRGPTALREFRDSLLLKSAVGTAMMDAYYRVSPVFAQFLLRHGRVLSATRWIARGVEWSLAHRAAVVGALAVCLAACLGFRRWSRRATKAAASVLVVVAALSFASPAQALFALNDVEEYVSSADDVVAGRVAVVDSHWTNDHRQIVTDITVEVDDVMKGRANKGGKIHLSLPTGKVGPIVRYSPQLPSFREGEEVVLFLKNSKQNVPLLVGGITGKYNVRTDPETGEKVVYAGSQATKVRLTRAIAKMAEKEETQADQAEASGEEGQEDEERPRPGTVLLDDFKDYLRDIDKEQRKAK